MRRLRGEVRGARRRAGTAGGPGILALVLAAAGCRADGSGEDAAPGDLPVYSIRPDARAFTWIARPPEVRVSPPSLNFGFVEEGERQLQLGLLNVGSAPAAFWA